MVLHDGRNHLLCRPDRLVAERFLTEDSVSYSTISRIITIRDHPASNAHQLDVVHLDVRHEHVTIVTGKHYRAGDLGLYIRPGCRIPGWLAEEGDFGTTGWFDVIEITKKGVPSPGIFYGSVWRKKKGKPYLKWRWWKSEWQEGDTLDDFIGIVPSMPEAVPV